MSHQFSRSAGHLQLGALLALLFSTASFGQATGALANKPILKLITSDGKVIYADRNLDGISVKKTETLNGTIANRVLASSGEKAINNENSEKLSDALKKTNGDPAAGPGSSAGASNQTVADPLKSVEGKQKDQSNALKDAQATVAKINCDQGQAALQSLNGARPGRTNDKGAFEFWTDGQLVEQKSQAQKMILQYCKS